MGALILLGRRHRLASLFAATIVLTLVSVPAGAREVAAWRAYVREAAARFAIPEAWIWRVMAAESGGKTHLGGRPITSHAGAMGLMQVMPATWAMLRTRHGLGHDPHDPRDNILAGSAYLRAMYDRFGYPGLFAAYNAGPGRYAEHLRGRILPRETRDYVAKIARMSPGASDNRAASSGMDELRPGEAARPTIFFRRSLEGEGWRGGAPVLNVPSHVRADEWAEPADSIFVLRGSGYGMGERP